MYFMNFVHLNGIRFRTVKGPLVSEVYQQIGTWAGQVIRLYRDSEYFEIEWTVGPIDVRLKS